MARIESISNSNPRLLLRVSGRLVPAGLVINCRETGFSARNRLAKLTKVIALTIGVLCLVTGCDYYFHQSRGIRLNSEVTGIENGDASIRYLRETVYRKLRELGYKPFAVCAETNTNLWTKPDLTLELFENGQGSIILESSATGGSHIMNRATKADLELRKALAATPGLSITYNDGVRSLPSESSDADDR